MSDDAYIPPSKRHITSNESLTVPCGCGHCISCEFGHGTATIHRRITFDDHGLLASHAVVDSIAADVASKAANYKKWADRYMAGQRIGRMDGKTIDSLREARISLDAALARYDALHKEAGQ